MEIKQTSLQAYQDIQTDGTAKTQKSDVLDFIKRYPDGLSRAEISEFLCIPINAVCGRCKELINEGSIFESGRKRNIHTGKENIILKTNEVYDEIYERKNNI